MWPWEHVAAGYLLVSLCSHAVGAGSPDGRIALAAAFGAVFPDLVDKPLSWTFGVFPSGYTVAHSAFVLPVFALAVWLAGSARDERGLAVAFLLGHVSHLAGDVAYPFVLGDGWAVTAVLWPVVETPNSAAGAGLLARALFYFGSWFGRLRAFEFGPLLLFETALVGVVVAVWLYDGAPVVAECRAYLTARAERRS